MRRFALLSLVIPFVGGCVFEPASPPDVAAARGFDRFPLYWLGEEFEGVPLVHVEARPESEIVTFVYGDCDPPGHDEGGCSPPLQIQIMALCPHLEIVRVPASANEPTIRGAPVGRADGAPVLLTKEVQIRAYRGQGVGAGIARRALAALRSVNDVAPVVDEDDPVPACAPGRPLGGACLC